MRMKRRRILLLPPRREPEAEEEQPLEEEPQVVGQRRIYRMSNVMCMESLGIMPASALKPTRDTLFLDIKDMPREGWYIDSGATCHMTSERLSLQEFTAQDSGFVRCGVHSSMVVVRGKGVVSLQIESCRILRVPGVLYVLGMRVGVLSISTLEYQGYSVNFFGCGVHIRSVRG
jgi:hypothetical protein